MCFRGVNFYDCRRLDHWPREGAYLVVESTGHHCRFAGCHDVNFDCSCDVCRDTSRGLNYY